MIGLHFIINITGDNDFRFSRILKFCIFLMFLKCEIKLLDITFSFILFLLVDPKTSNSCIIKNHKAPDSVKSFLRINYLYIYKKTVKKINA